MPRPADLFVRTEAGEAGPLTAVDLRRMAASGELTIRDSIRRGSGQWTPAFEVRGLEFSAAPAVPPPPTVEPVRIAPQSAPSASPPPRQAVGSTGRIALIGAGCALIGAACGFLPGYLTADAPAAIPVVAEAPAPPEKSPVEPPPADRELTAVEEPPPAEPVKPVDREQVRALLSLTDLRTIEAEPGDIVKRNGGSVMANALLIGRPLRAFEGVKTIHGVGVSYALGVKWPVETTLERLDVEEEFAAFRGQVAFAGRQGEEPSLAWDFRPTSVEMEDGTVIRWPND